MTEQAALALQTRHSEILPSRNDWAVMLEMASAFLKSGLLPSGIKTPEAALLIIQKGKELGVQPTYALSNIAIIQGKPVAGAELMLALIYRDHGDNALRITETSETRCVIDYRRRNWPEASTFAFSMEDAKRANLTGKDNWKNYPAAMLRARCISAVARLAFPDTIGGLYTAEEMGAEVRVDPEGQVELIEHPQPTAPARLVDTATGEVLDGPVNVKHDKLLDQVTESLRQLTAKRQTTGKKLMIEWTAETGGKNTPMDMLNNPQLENLLAWSEQQLKPATPGPTGQRYTAEQIANAPEAARQEAAKARAEIDQAIAATSPTDESESF